MAPLPCSCDKGVAACATALRLWESYIAARQIEAELLVSITDPNGDGDSDPIMYDRYRLAGEERRAALRAYDRHVDGEDFVPEPQSLKVVP
jgi:hypothetical protein